MENGSLREISSLFSHFLIHVKLLEFQVSHLCNSSWVRDKLSLYFGAAWSVLILSLWQLCFQSELVWVFGQSYSRNPCSESLFYELLAVWQRLSRWFLGTDYRSPSNFAFLNLPHLSRPASVLCHLFIVFPTPFLGYLTTHPFKLKSLENRQGTSKLHSRTYKHSAVILCRFTSWTEANLSWNQNKLQIVFAHMQ